jgi:hypothetical protein
MKSGSALYDVMKVCADCSDDYGGRGEGMAKHGVDEGCTLPEEVRSH